MSQTAMDAAAFTEMKELMGDSFTDVVSMCLQNLPEQSNQLEAAISNNDAEQVFNIAHRLKSSCGSIGAFGLAEKIEAIELIGRDGSTNVSDQAYNELHDAATQVISILTAELGAEGA